MLIHQYVFVLAVNLNVSTLTLGEPCVFMWLLSCYSSGAKVAAVNVHEGVFRCQSHCWELSDRPEMITFCWHFKQQILQRGAAS